MLMLSVEVLWLLGREKLAVVQSNQGLLHPPEKKIDGPSEFHKLKESGRDLRSLMGRYLVPFMMSIGITYLLREKLTDGKLPR